MSVPLDQMQLPDMPVMPPAAYPAMQMPDMPMLPSVSGPSFMQGLGAFLGSPQA
jgi:hypothetical protein